MLLPFMVSDSRRRAGAAHGNGARTRRTEHGARGASAAPAHMLETLGFCSPLPQNHGTEDGEGKG